MNRTLLSAKSSNLVADVASACNRIGTWGLDEPLRADLLAERSSDLAAQLEDPARNSAVAILSRAVRTLLGDMRRRLTSDHISALPLAFALLIGGVGTLTYSALNTDLSYRISLALTGAGLVILAITGIRFPLAIRPVPSAVGAIVLASGMALGVIAIPVESEVILFVVTAKTSLALATVGFTSLAAGLTTGWETTPKLTGATLLLAAGLIAFSEIGWALYMAGESSLQVLAAALTAAGGLLFFRFFGRLRHLPIMPLED